MARAHNLIANKKKQCPNCLKEISIPNFNKHYQSCIDVLNPKKYSVYDYYDGNGFKCNICFEYFSKYGIKQHIYLTHELTLEERKERSKRFYKYKPRKAWNKGLTKESDSRVRKNAESLSETINKQIQNGTYIKRSMGVEARKRLSIEQSLHNRGGKSKWFEVNNQKVQGTYELLFAQKLEQQQIKWERIKLHNHIFKYEMDNKIKSYTPDFYLPELNLYVEIKGHWWGNDENKMKKIKHQHFDKNVIILFGLEKIKDICEDIKTKLLKEPFWAW